MNVIEQYINDNSIPLETVEAWTYKQLRDLFGVQSDTYYKKQMRTIIAQMYRDIELGNLSILDQGPMGTAIREAALSFGYSEPDFIFDHKNKHIIIRLNGTPPVEDDM